MDAISSVALAVLGSCVMITWVLSKARVLGALTLTGFLLGVLTTASLFVLIGQ